MAEPVSTPPLKAPSRTIDVVTMGTTGASTGALDAARRRLSPTEVARADRFVHQSDRHTFTLAHALVRATLSEHAATPPGDWQFDANAHGCPSVVAEQAGAPILQFNLSHTDGLVVVAVTRGHRLGVDVERVDRVVHAGVAERHFAPAEVRALRALPEVEQPRAFFDYWTLKEAYIKARGLGLALPLDAFAFTLAPPSPPSIRFVDGFDDTPARWQFWQAWPTSSHRLSLAVERDGPDLEITLRSVSAEAFLT
jgi:4'-phosphopantetheinyl transferase